MFVSIYYKPSLFNAHTMILIVHIFMTVNKLCLNQAQQQQQQNLNPILPSTGHKNNIAQPTPDNSLCSTSHCSPFNFCLGVVL